MRILISAAETSSDIHGAALLRAIRDQRPSEVSLEAFGIGGPKLRAEGFEAIVPAEELLAMGWVEILRKLPTFWKSLRRIQAVVRERKPELAVFIDYPDFHFQLARRLRGLGIPLIYYIPPKVWVWRKGRVRFLKKFFLKILCILPFEEEFYAQHQIPVHYVGNPLIDELPWELSQAQARQQLGIDPEARVMVLMPGSRPAELRQHLSLMLKTAERVFQVLRSKTVQIKGLEKLTVLLPIPSTLWTLFQTSDFQQLLFSASSDLEIRVFENQSAECLVASEMGIIKSGTSTLEAGLLRCPHVITYRPYPLTAWLFKYLVRYRGPVGLVNLVAGVKKGRPYLVPELISEKATVENLTQEILRLWMGSSDRERMLEGFDDLKLKVCGLGGHLHPSQKAAALILETVKHLKSLQPLEAPSCDSSSAS